MYRAWSAQKVAVLVIFLVSFTGLYYAINESNVVEERKDLSEDERRSLLDLFTVYNNGLGDKQKYSSLCNENFLGNPYYLVKELRDFIVGLTNMVNAAQIQLLEGTLASTSADLPTLLRKIKRFEKLQRCATCSNKRTLPATFIGTNSSIQTCGYWNGFRLPVIGVKPIGRLGNVMGEYATLVALKEIFNATAVLTTAHQETLLKFFPHLSLPVVDIGLQSNWTELPEEKAYHPYYGGLQLAAQGLLGSKLFLSTGYPFEMSLFNAHRDKIRTEFRFSDEIVKQAQNFLAQVAGKHVRSQPDKAISFIGVHIRMTDYMSHITNGFGSAPVDYEQFVTRAVSYYKSKQDDLIFVVTSDDTQHAKKIFQKIGQLNVFYSEGSPGGDPCFFSLFTSKDRPGEDMALLAQCNHSIITLGSYGFFAGYLSQGQVLYPDVKTTKPYPFSKSFYEEAKLDNFIPIKLYN